MRRCSKYASEACEVGVKYGILCESMFAVWASESTYDHKEQLAESSIRQVGFSPLHADPAKLMRVSDLRKSALSPLPPRGDGLGIALRILGDGSSNAV